MDIRFTINAFPALYGVFLAAAVVTLILYSRRGAAQGQRGLFYRLLMCLYGTGVLYFVLFPIDVNIGQYAATNPWYNGIQWIPVFTIDLSSFVKNILLFVPLGLLLPLISGRVRSFRQAGQNAFRASLGIELVQLAVRITLGSGRTTDVNDLIANTLGGLLGYAAYLGAVRIPALNQLLGADRKPVRPGGPAN